MFLANTKLHLTADETSQLAVLLEVSENVIRSLTHRPNELRQRIESVLESDTRMDETIKYFRAYYLPIWQKRLSIYKE